MLGVVIESEEEECDANTWVGSPMPKDVLYGRGTQDRLAAPCKTVEPQELMGLCKRGSKGRALDEPESGATMPLLAVLVVIDGGIMSFQPHTDR